MAPIVHSIEIARPPAEVFAYATDPTTFPEWQNDVVSVRMAGSCFTTTRRIGGAERSMTQEVIETVAPVRWAAHGIDGPIRPDATITVEPVAGGTRSRITFTLDFTGRGVGADPAAGPQAGTQDSPGELPEPAPPARRCLVSRAGNQAPNSPAQRVPGRRHGVADPPKYNPVRGRIGALPAETWIHRLRHRISSAGH